jgi:hypothetical protein
MEPEPGWFAGRKDLRPRTMSGRTAIRTGAELKKQKIHQVWPRSYGDAIGHEVLGIQRVLRSAGFESDIFSDRRSAPRG